MADLTIRTIRQNPETTARVTSILFDVAQKRAVVAVEVYREDGAFSRTIYANLADGEDPAEKWLTGKGVNGEPVGLFRAVIEPPSGERGLPETRFLRRVLEWVKANRKDLDDMVVL